MAPGAGDEGEGGVTARHRPTLTRAAWAAATVSWGSWGSSAAGGRGLAPPRLRRALRRLRDGVTGTGAAGGTGNRGSGAGKGAAGTAPGKEVGGPRGTAPPHSPYPKVLGVPDAGRRCRETRSLPGGHGLSLASRHRDLASCPAWHGDRAGTRLPLLLAVGLLGGTGSPKPPRDVLVEGGTLLGTGHPGPLTPCCPLSRGVPLKSPWEQPPRWVLGAGTWLPPQQQGVGETAGTFRGSQGRAGGDGDDDDGDDDDGDSGRAPRLAPHPRQGNAGAARGISSPARPRSPRRFRFPPVPTQRWQGWGRRGDIWGG